MRAFFFFRQAPIGPEQQDDLAVLRERDRLLVLENTQPSTRQIAYGGALLGATIIMTAHAPQALRPIFDARFHLGPAVLDGGGLGAAFGGTWK